MKRIISIILSICMLISLACNIDSKTAYAGKAKVKKVKVNAPYSKSITMAKGKKIKLTAVVKTSSKNKKVIYKCSNKKIATVNKKGVVKAKKVGKAKVTVKSSLNKKKKVVLKLKVVKNAVKKVVFDKNEASVKVGDVFAINTTVSGKKGAFKKLFWTTSDATVVSVNQKGKVTALKNGTAVIKAKSIDVVIRLRLVL